MSKLAIAAAVPQMSIAMFLHDTMHDLFKCLDPHIVPPRSYLPIRRFISKMRTRIESGMFTLLHSLKNRISLTFDIWLVLHSLHNY